MTGKSLALAILLLVAGCGGTDQSASISNDQPAAASTVAPIALNKTGKAAGVDFTISKVEMPKQLGPAGVGATAGEGETFIVVSYTLKNTASAPLPFLERPAVRLVDGTGQTYAPDDIASGMSAISMDDPSGLASDLNPNVSAKVKAAWKVDKSAFDKATWKVVVASDPQLTFALK